MSITPERRDHVVPQPTGVRATLRTSGGEALSVQTYEGGEEVVLLVLSDLGHPPTVDAPDPATLEYTTMRGVIRLHGEAVFTHRSLVRFHAAGDPEVVQRRAFVRAHTSNRISLDPPRSRTDAPPAHTVDVSGGGMLLFGAGHLVLGDVVHFEMSVGEGEPPINGRARVVRIDADGRRGLQFEHIEEADRQRLIRLVFTCMRAARAKTRGDLV